MRFQNAEKLLKNYIKQAKWNYTKTKPPQGLAPYTAVKMNPYLLDKVQVHYNKNRRQGSAGLKLDVCRTQSNRTQPPITQLRSMFNARQWSARMESNHCQSCIRRQLYH